MLNDKIRKVRREKDISQALLAEKIGLNQTQLSKIEKGIRKVDAIELKKIADALGVNINELLTA